MIRQLVVVMLLLSVSVLAEASSIGRPPVLQSKTKEAEKRKLTSRLQEAFLYDDVVKMRDLVKAGADPNAIYRVGEVETTLLNVAIRKANVAMVRALLGMGADPVAIIEPADSPSTGLFVALSTGNRKLADIVLAHKLVTPRELDRQGVLHDAAWRNDVEFVRLLVSKGASLKARITFSTGYAIDMSPLHHAAENGSTEALKALIELGADANALDSNGDLPIFHAAINLHEQAVKVLLAQKPKLTGSNSRNMSLLTSIEWYWLEQHRPGTPEERRRVIALLREAGAR